MGLGQLAGGGRVRALSAALSAASEVLIGIYADTPGESKSPTRSNPPARSPATAEWIGSASTNSVTWNSTNEAPSYFLGVDRTGGKNSVAIASNESFSRWTTMFTDPRLCTAIVDRLTFGGNIIETGTDSYRLAHTRARQSA